MLNENEEGCCGPAVSTDITSVADDEVLVPASSGRQADSWEVEISTVDQCSKAPSELLAQIEVLAKVKIDALMDKFPNIEWLAYLIGDKNQPLVVQDLYIPQQDVTGTSVDNIQCPEFNTLSIIGVIHSHHGMGTGFSGTDHAWINQNHNLSIVVAKNGIAGQFRWKTPCGSLKIIPVKCRVKYDLEFDKEVFLQESTPRIKPKSYATSQSYSYQNGRMVPTQTTWPQSSGRIHSSDQAKYVAGVSVKEAARASDPIHIKPVKGFEDEQSLVAAMEEAFSLE
jgi:hypothetical protein